METRAHHVLIGLFSVIVIGAALLFGLWLAKSGSEGKFNYYDIVFNEAVSGLSQGSSVQYSGIKVGDVAFLRLDPKDPRKVWARIRVVASAPIKQDTTAKLALTGITGTSIIQLSSGARQPDAGGQGREDPGDRRHALAADPVTEQRRRPDGQHQPAHRALQQPALRGKHSAHQPHPRPSRPGHRRALRRTRERQRGDAAVGPGE